jgi:signal transduction histidine kinase
MFNRANGEKKLLSLINATVSHEMRNPLNSIYSQNLKQKQLSEKFAEILESKMSTKKLKKALKTLRQE